MYQYTLADLETSGYEPGRDRTLSISYLQLDENLRIQGAGNHFIYHPDIEISKEATAIHHLDQEFLSRYGQSLETVCDKLYTVFQRTLLVGHNIEFDARFLKRDFVRVQYDLNFTELLCTMKATTDACAIRKVKRNGEPSNSFKWPKLAEACDHFGVTDNMVKMIYEKNFGSFNIPLNLSFHSSAYDVSATYAMLLRGGWPCVRQYYNFD